MTLSARYISTPFLSVIYSFHPDVILSALSDGIVPEKLLPTIREMTIGSCCCCCCCCLATTQNTDMDMMYVLTDTVRTPYAEEMRNDKYVCSN